MIAYIFRRVLISVPLLLAMSFITFGFIRLPEGDVLAPYRHDPKFSPEEVRKLERKYHFDRAFYVQYYYWMKNMFFQWPERDVPSLYLTAKLRPLTPLRVRIPSGILGAARSWIPTGVRLDMGYSFGNRQPVISVISGRLLNTLVLSIVSMVLVWAVAIPIGTYCAVHQYSVGDKVLSFLSFIGMSFPSFFLALVLLYVVSLTGVLPIGGLTSPDHDTMSLAGKLLDYAGHMLIPAVVIVTGSMAGMQRLMRGNMLEVLRKQYVTTARAKGLPENKVIYRHALRNALNPMITIFGYQFSGLLSGVALTEMITSYPGLGSIMLEAVRAQDIYLVMSSAMIGGVLLIIGNLIADVLLAMTDPRISYE
jgi:peptide/nickel transport system permease protein